MSNAFKLSSLRVIAYQRLPDVGLGNPELSGNLCRRDASLKGGADSLHLATSQMNLRQVRVPSTGDFIC
jgi:hypothetical protein